MGRRPNHELRQAATEEAESALTAPEQLPDQLCQARPGAFGQSPFVLRRRPPRRACRTNKLDWYHFISYCWSGVARGRVCMARTITISDSVIPGLVADPVVVSGGPLDGEGVFLDGEYDSPLCVTDPEAPSLVHVYILVGGGYQFVKSEPVGSK